MQFIYCVDDKKKLELLNKGLKYLQETQLNGIKTFVFLNNKHLQFNNTDGLMFSDKLTF